MSPPEEISSLIKVTLFVHRKLSLSKDEFENYWTNEHPKALSAFNDKLGRPIRRYIQCHRNPTIPFRGQKQMERVFGRENVLDEGYEAVVEVWFDRWVLVRDGLIGYSIEKMVETYTHPLYEEMVSPDEAKFGSGPMRFAVQQEVRQWSYTERF